MSTNKTNSVIRYLDYAIALTPNTKNGNSNQIWDKIGVKMCDDYNRKVIMYIRTIYNTGAAKIFKELMVCHTFDFLWAFPVPDCFISSFCLGFYMRKITFQSKDEQRKNRRHVCFEWYGTPTATWIRLQTPSASLPKLGLQKNPPKTESRTCVIFILLNSTPTNPINRLSTTTTTVLGTTTKLVSATMPTIHAHTNMVKSKFFDWYERWIKAQFVHNVHNHSLIIPFHAFLHY